MLDAALNIAGVGTFLDERDIRAGDSITGKIYEAISTATDLVYIISENSAKSPWVKEELTLAKVRRRKDEGFAIFPVLIDQTEPPSAVSDMRYVDMRSWRDPAAYREAMLQLLVALDIEPVLVGTEHVNWWLVNRPRLEAAWRPIRECFLKGATSGLTYAASPVNQAARRYSWIRPPMTSTRSIRSGTGSGATGAGPDGIGVCRLIPRWGRPLL